MRLYSEDEARAAIPEVRPIVQRMRDAYVQVRAIQALQVDDGKRAAADGASTVSPWNDDDEGLVDRLMETLQSAAAELEERGIEVKDPARGLVDFYSLRGGETVYLCWELGEDDLRWWHTLEGGFAGRKPL
jgi:hypothetical protein